MSNSVFRIERSCLGLGLLVDIGYAEDKVSSVTDLTAYPLKVVVLLGLLLTPVTLLRFPYDLYESTIKLGQRHWENTRNLP